MDDKHTRIEISDRASLNKPEEYDVIEAPERWVWLGSQQELRFGTAGEGLEFGNLVWPKGKHVLRIEHKGLCEKFLG
jgi:hypothetical protein